MSMLADKFVNESTKNMAEIKGKWYIAKWISYVTIKGKIKDCIKILSNKAIAVHFKEDE